MGESSSEKVADNEKKKDEKEIRFPYQYGHNRLSTLIAMRK